MVEHDWELSVPYNPAHELTIRATCNKCGKKVEGSMELKQVLEEMLHIDTDEVCGHACHICDCEPDDECVACGQHVCSEHNQLVQGEPVCINCLFSRAINKMNEGRGEALALLGEYELVLDTALKMKFGDDSDG